MRASAFVYPWDVIGDPAAADRIAALGVHQVTLAAAYHSARALTPRHPRHRVVTAEHSAVLYPPDEERWRGRELRPYTAGRWADGSGSAGGSGSADGAAGTDGAARAARAAGASGADEAADAYGTAAAALAAAGLDVHTWVVLAHNSRLGSEHPRTNVVNAYGDPYPWAPCIARPDVRAYLVELAAEAAVRPGALGTELESLGWYGLAHLHAHDKIGGVPLGDAAQYLMSLCFCPHCREGYAALGADPGKLAAAVRRALDPVWAGSTDGDAGGSAGGSADGSAGGSAGGGAAGVPGIEALLGAENTALTLDWRTATARSLQEQAVAAVRRAAAPGFQVLMHADPAPYRCGSNAGVEPAHILGHTDGLVLPCPGGPGGAEGRKAVLAPAAEHATQGTVLAANFTVVAAMGGSPGTLAADAAHAAALGATQLRLYHAGLAGDADLEAVRLALREVSPAR